MGEDAAICLNDVSIPNQILNVPSVLSSNFISYSIKNNENFHSQEIEDDEEEQELEDDEEDTNDIEEYIDRFIFQTIKRDFKREIKKAKNFSIPKGQFFSAAEFCKILNLNLPSKLINLVEFETFENGSKQFIRIKRDPGDNTISLSLI